MQATIFNVQKFCTDDGPGIRTTVFFKGCNLKCEWCHNPESQNAKQEELLFKDKCVGCGRCAEVTDFSTFRCYHSAREWCGKTVSCSELLEEILKDKAFYDHSGGGATFSGGECMLQIDFLQQILKACKENGVHTTVDTAGHVPWEYFERILPYADLFLFDVKHTDDDKHKLFTGVSNSLILNNLKKLSTAGKDFWIRVPTVEGVNAEIEDALRLKEFISTLPTAPKKIDLLPYHDIGSNKYRALNKNPPAFSVPSEQKMQELRKIFD